MGYLAAQVVSSIPVFPTISDSIVVIFNAAEGNGGLAGYTGNDVYAHTGVITASSSGPGDWRYVVAPWSVNLPKCRLTRIAGDLWRLNIGLVRSFYNIPPGEQVLKLAFVFRNGNGTVTGRDVGGADIFLDLYEPGLTVVLLAPVVDLTFGDPRRSPVFCQPGDTVAIRVATATLGTVADSLWLYHEDQLLLGVADSALSCDWIPIAADYGMRQLMVIGADTAGLRDTLSFQVIVNPPVRESPLPEQVKPGINLHSGQSATLALFAPDKEFVYLIGDFNDWMVDTAYCLIYSPGDSIFWITLGNLTAGTEYAFQYLVDGQIRVADPYTPKILDPWNDGYIASALYPNLKPYPAGKTKEAVAILQTNPAPYIWGDSSFTRAPQSELIIYELLVRDFSHGHSYKAVRDSIEYFKRLGINAIELMPVSEFEGNSSWGYNPSFYFAPDKYYGPAQALKELVDVCHQNGIAVIMDIVLNHAYPQCPLVRLYWDAENGRPAANNPWFNVQSPNTQYSWGYDFNHESPYTRQFVDRVTAYWLTEFHMDGFRFDFTKGFTNRSGDGWAYDASRIAILKRMADQIWAVDSTAYVILEHFCANSEEQVLANYGMMLWGNLNYNYCEASMGWHKNSSNVYGQSDFSGGYYGTRSWSKPHLVTYMESHDEERMMYRNKQYGNYSSGYDIRTLPVGLNRLKLTAGFFLTFPGPKMLWQFEELGYDFSIDYNGRVGEKPVRWNYYQEPYRRRVFDTFAALISLRRNHPVFHSPQTAVQMTVLHEAKRIKLDHPQMKAVILGNFDVIAREVGPAFQHPGRWYEYFSGDSLEVGDVNATLPFVAGELRIYTDVRIPPPAGDVLNELLPPPSAGPSVFRLQPCYPNPFNGWVQIPFELDQAALVDLRIFDLTGKEIYSRSGMWRAPGMYTLMWDGCDQNGHSVASGVYLVCVARNGQRLFHKATLLK